jgi:transcriptional regulator with XRE-family HTH domain
MIPRTMKKQKPPPYSTVVGRFLRLERECKKTSLSEIAKALGYSTSGWSRVETGETPISVDQLKRACDVLKTTPHALIEEADTFWRRNYAP